METVQVQCPVCGAFGAPGSFCEMGCGRLPQTVAATPALVSQSRSLPSVSAEWGAPRIVATRPDRFAEGCVEQVAFAYGFAADVFERLEISVRDGADELGALGTDHRPGRSGELRLNVQPRRAGHLVLTVEVACHLDNEAERLVYRGELEVEVTPRLSHVTFSPTITITGNYGNDLAGTRIGNLNLPGVERAEVSPVVNPLLLTLVRMPERLLLTCPERTLQVFARDRIALGRSRGNDVVLRVFDPAEQPRDDVSRRLSGTHVRLIVDRDGVELQDGGDRPSTNGTFVDGRALPPGGRSTVRSGACEIGFGPGTDDFKLRMTVHADAFGRTTGCLIDRTDGARRRTMLLVREVPLDAQGTSLTWDGGVFAVLSPDGRRKVLALGGEVDFDGRKWRVEPFRPTWIHNENN